MSQKLKILPLGGLGEIGKNMAVVEYDGRIIVIDVGLMFPTAEMLGIDLVLPNFDYLRGRVDDIEAIVLTHGHEDHVGALPFLLRELGFPKQIVGGRLTVAMVRSKLDEHRLKEAPLTELPVGERLEAGPFTLELIHVAHSIPDACGVAITSPVGTVLFTGDYKFDQTPVDGWPTDVSRLAELGRDGLLCLCGDSTNADRPGTAPSESTTGPALEELFARCQGRIIATSFASNVHRVQQVIDAAERLNRKVALVGRSMRKNFNIARNLGIANANEGTFVQPDEIDDFPDERIVVICTGSQGEPLSALRRMAHNDHRQITLHADDTVVFSATPVPGNERAVNETIDRIFEIGASVVTARDAPIHASGHGWQEELKLMLNLTKPQFVMPVHGDYQRIRLHAGLAEAVGVAPERIFKGRNGLPLELTAESARFGEQQPGGPIFVDGLELGEPEDAALRDRKAIADEGIVIVVATISADGAESAAEPEVVFRGIPTPGDSADLHDEIRDLVDDVLDDAGPDAIGAPELIQQDLHDELGRFLHKRMRRRPLILPVVIEV